MSRSCADISISGSTVTNAPLPPVTSPAAPPTTTTSTGAGTTTRATTAKPTTGTYEIDYNGQFKRCN